MEYCIYTIYYTYIIHRCAELHISSLAFILNACAQKCISCRAVTGPKSEAPSAAGVTAPSWVLAVLIEFPWIFSFEFSQHPAVYSPCNFQWETGEPFRIDFFSPKINQGHIIKPPLSLPAKPG